MKDIRSVLGERLTEIAAEKQSLQARLCAVESEEDLVKSLLALEEQRFGSGTYKVIAAVTVSHPEADHADTNGFGDTPVSKLILETLKSSTRPVGLDEFKRRALEAKIDFGAKKPGRVLHWALVGLTQNGHLGVIGTDENRKYYIKEAEEQQAGTTDAAVPARV